MYATGRGGSAYIESLIEIQGSPIFGTLYESWKIVHYIGNVDFREYLSSDDPYYILTIQMIAEIELLYQAREREVQREFDMAIHGAKKK